MKIWDLVLIGILIVVGLTQSGCASFNRNLKNFLSGQQSEAQKNNAVGPTRFSESPDLEPRVKRQYKRTTKESLAQESALDPKSGSLWVMEGQGAYLFSQNIVRLVGDPIGVTLEGDPKDQLASKVSVIKKLLAKIEERQKLRARNPAGEEGGAPEKDEKGEGKKGEGAEKKEAAQPKANEPPAPTKEEAVELAIKTVPARIVERTLEGNYRVKGSQPFMIGSREYKVIVTGVVKAEDFNDDGISATKLLDPKFDIVSARRKEEVM